MKTDELIERLSSEVPRVPRSAVARRLGLGLLAGVVASLVVLMLTLGFRPDLKVAVLNFPFWMKWGYTASLAAAAAYFTSQIARPDAREFRRLWLVVIPICVLAAIAIAELMDAPRSEWLSMWLDHSWKVCSSLVLMLSVPIFLGLLWSFRCFAPTRLGAAGAVAGLTAGASAATVYCFHCPEVSAIFVLTWYTLGIAFAALAGALIGPRLLRW